MAERLHLNCLIKSGALESTTEGFTSFSILHGSTDAPTVDIFTRSGVKLANNAGYTDMTDYIAVESAPYIVDLTASDDSSVVYVSHDVNLSGLSGQTVIVFASGFINSDENKNGPGFGLFAALANGTVAQFPELMTARLQVIHNAADIAADPVDIYLRNGDYDSVVVKLDDFAFRTATPFVDVPAGDSLSVEVAGPSSSESGDQVIAAIPVGSLLPGATYTVIANGVVTPGDYKANPEGRDIAFQLLATDSRESGNGQEDEVMFKVLHGATDAPAVDIIARDVATLVDGAAYTDITPYVTVDANKYILDITPDEDNDTVVASFTADLSGLGGGVAFVFASGFLSPSENQNGPAFGIYAALTDGTVVEFPAAGTARLQVIHNAVDIAADPVDIYLKNGTADSVIVKLDDFKFREVYTICYRSSW